MLSFLQIGKQGIVRQVQQLIQVLPFLSGQCSVPFLKKGL